MKRKSIIAVILLTMLFSIGIVHSCGETDFYAKVMYEMLPLQDIRNVQVLGINKIQVELDYPPNSEETLMPSNFQISDTNGNRVEVISIVWNEEQTENITIETEFLSDETSYTLTIFNVLSDKAKQIPDEGISFDFITIEFVDNDPPEVLSYCIHSDSDHEMDYGNGWESVDADPIYPVLAIEFVFDEPVDPITVKGSFYLFVNGTEMDVPTPETSDFRQVITFSYSDLRIRSKCQIVLTNDVKDAKGNAITNPIEQDDDIHFYIGDPEGADDFEPDDSFEDATEIQLNTLYFGTIHSENDEDYYKITLNGDEKMYIITLDNIPDDCEYDIQLYYAPDYASEVTNLSAYPVDYVKYLFNPSIGGNSVYYIRIHSLDGYSVNDYYNLIINDYELDYWIYFNTNIINASNVSNSLITIKGANDSDTYNFDIISNGSEQGITDKIHLSGTVSSGDITLDLGELYDGILNIQNFTLTDTGGNKTSKEYGINYAIKDIVAPRNGLWTASGMINPGGNIITMFSEVMDRSLVEDIGNYDISGSGIEITDISYVSSFNIATFTISYSGTDGTEDFTITPLASITDQANNPLTVTVSETYTARDLTIPRITNWGDLTDLGGSYFSIDVTFSEDVSNAGLSDNYQLNVDNISTGSVEFYFIQYNNPITTIYIYISGTNGTEYFTIEAINCGTAITDGTNNLDLESNNPSGNYLATDTAPPYISYWSGLTDIGSDQYSIYAYFSEEVSNADNPANYKLNNGSISPGSVSINNIEYSSQIVTFTLDISDTDGQDTFTIEAIDGGTTISDGINDLDLTVNNPSYNYKAPLFFSSVIKRDMVTVPGGLTYTQEDTDSNSFEHTISGFLIGQYEVTYELWYIVKIWALSNGYNFVNSGIEGNNGSSGTPTSARYEPVVRISWRDAMVWCNAYSEMVGLDPVYYTDSGFLTPRRTSSASPEVEDVLYTNSGELDNPYVDWTANGYRLPTEGEWQYAASYIDGSSWTPFNYASGSTVPYGDNPETDAVAWFSYNSSDSTHDVGLKAPNALGIYDMSGNASEYCWDWRDDYPAGPEEDYQGPGSPGDVRVVRSGRYNSNAVSLQIGLRTSDTPYDEDKERGFRVAKSQ